MNITKFGLSNFRIFKEHFDFDLAPIMVLTGPNNSGKSSFSKALLLLKENDSLMKSGTLWGRFSSYFESEHDLGNHRLVINSTNKDTIFSFTFFQDYTVHYALDNDGGFRWDYRITNKDNDLVIGQDYIGINYNIPNLIEYFRARLKVLVANNDTASKFKKLDIDKIGKLMNSLYRIYINTLNPIISADVGDYNYNYDVDLMLVFHFKHLTRLKISTTLFNYLIPQTKPGFFSLTDLYYISTIKEPLKRFYSSQERSVIQKLIIADLMKTRQEVGWRDARHIDINKIDHRVDSYKSFIQKWLKEFDIGITLTYGYDDNNCFYFIKIDGRSLPEFGLGYGLIIHILLALSNEIGRERQKETESLKMQFPPTYIIEEPETGLHPAFQSKMAEMLVDIQKTFNVNLIIETHSEYFIRKLQYLTATNEVSSGDVVIYYFNNPKKVPENEEQIKRITILKDGSLSDNFGPGFIDEGINLKFELLRLNKSQIN